MAKLTLADIANVLGNPTSAANTINVNNARVEAALENTLSRDGSTPNQMLVDIDLNNNDLLNVQTIEAGSLVLDGAVVTPDELATIPPTVMTKVVYDPDGKNADVYDSVNHDFLQVGTGAVNRSSQSKMREYASFLDFNAVGDGTTDDSAAVTAATATGLYLDGLYRTYNVSSPPSDFSKISRAAFKVGTITYISKDYLRTDTARITDNYTYTGWAEVKSYLIVDSLRVWSLEKESHADGTARIGLVFSDAGGSSYSPMEYLEPAASGRTLWSAGFDPSTSTEYLLVRVPPGTVDVPAYTYEVWSRVLVLGPANLNINTAPWTVTPVTFPTPPGFTGQPIMVIDFTVGHGGSIVVGASYGEGAAVARSTDSGATWTTHILLASSTAEEPTVRYDPVQQIYCGFMRYGGSGNPRYWHSAVDDLDTIAVYTAPAGTFGPNGMQASPVPFDIRNSRIHGFASYRTGTQEGNADDELTSAFYLDMPVFAGNIWSQASTIIYRLGTLPHREGAGSASAVGVGAVVIHEDKVHLIYGMEERTGATASLNRIANIYQTVIFLTDRNGMFDFRNDLVQNRSSGPLRRMPNNGGLAVYLGDGSTDMPAILSGRPNYATRHAAVDLVSGVLTLTTLGRYGRYIMDTEASAAADDLDTITDGYAREGDVIVLRTFSSSRDITVKHGTGNIRLNGQVDKLLSNVADYIALMFDGTNWNQFTFSDNLV